MSDREEIEADIEATREQLADTVSALGEKLDVKAHVKDSAHQAAENVKARPAVPVGVAVAALAVVALVVWRRTR